MYSSGKKPLFEPEDLAPISLNTAAIIFADTPFGSSSI
jgi:hypothetical protein